MSGVLLRALEYLVIPRSYAREAGGLRWAHSGELIEREDGSTFAFNVEIGHFLEGFASSGRIVHFGFILELLSMLRGAGDEAALPLEILEIRRAFALAGKPLRNAGVLSAYLCRSVPAVAEPVSASEILHALAHSNELKWVLLATLAAEGAAPGEDAAEKPPLELPAFREAIARAIREAGPQDWVFWLKHGEPPRKAAGEAIAREIEATKPPSLGEILAAVSRRGRLQGAVPLVEQLVSALSLPPRKLAPSELPLGGYTDIATRGNPEQLLVGQLALDELELVRRYAANELLFYRREEPHGYLREDLVLLVDQGVRTWGGTRLLLAAAALALGKLASRRGVHVSVAGTSSSGRPVDPLLDGEEVLGALLEASDLTRDPGAALERVLEDRGAPARDVVLLTHPRALAEADVAAAARRAGEGTRVFAVSASDAGEVQLSELRRGIPVKLRAFKVDASRVESVEARDALRSVEDTRPLAPWIGDREPVAFPFRFGLSGKRFEARAFDFDDSGEWLMAATENGMLHVFSTDGWSRMEVLPRGFFEGTLLTDVDCVIGVKGGFCVAGRLKKRGPAQPIVQHIVFHYEMARRIVTAHPIVAALVDGPAQWFYFQDLHSIAVRVGEAHLGLDLATGKHSAGKLTPSDSRTAKACARASELDLPPPSLAIHRDGAAAAPRGPSIRLDGGRGALSLDGVSPAWKPFTPLGDGQPILKRCSIMQAQFRANTLAASFYHAGAAHRAKDRFIFRLFRGPEGASIAEYPRSFSHHGFVLSSDGKLLARDVGSCRIEVRNVASSGPPLFETPVGKYHHGIEVELGDVWLAIHAGKLAHVVRWDEPKLVLRHARGKVTLARELEGRSAVKEGVRSLPLSATPDRNSVLAAFPSFLDYDRKRFVAAAKADLMAVVDVFGQVFVLEPRGPLVCAFFVYKGQLAAAMPDGTRHGPSSVTGGASTPGALERLAGALRLATEKARGAR